MSPGQPPGDAGLQSPVSSRLDLEMQSCSSWQGCPLAQRSDFSPKSVAGGPSAPSLPRGRTSLCSDLSRRISQPLLGPALGDSQASSRLISTSDNGGPSWWACAAPEWVAVAVPLLVLLVTTACWFAVGGLTARGWYAALYAALTLAMLLFVFLHLTLSTQRLLQDISDSLVTLLAEHDDETQSVAWDDRFWFLHDLLRIDKAEAVVPRDPLDFIWAELQALPTGPEGYVVTNTTGVIMWANAALLHYFGYTMDELLQQNIRVLMPNPYASQHDYFMRKHVDTGVCCVLGKSREVPALDKSGTQSVVMMGLDDRIDPLDATNRLFIAKMDFNSEDAPLQTARHRLASSVPVTEALKALAAVPEAVVATNAQGIILFANQKAYDLFQWPDEGLLGENVRVLMAEPFASAHDGFIKSYQTRAENALHQGASWPTSKMVGSGRDVMAMAKSGHRVRVFLMLTRMDRPSGRPRHCVFVAKMVHVSQDDSANPAASDGTDSTHDSVRAAPPLAGGARTCPVNALDLRRGSTTLTIRTTVSNVADMAVRRFLPRRCTVVGLIVEGLGSSVDPAALHRDFTVVMGLVSTQCSQQRGTPHWVVGTQLFVVFNLPALPNQCHRTSAATFMLQLAQAFAAAPLAQRCTLRMAAVSADTFCTQWGSHQLLTGNPLHCASVLLSAQRESRTKNPVIDGCLFEELQYTFECRRVNRAVLPEGGTVLDVYELLAVREASTDQWVYELPAEDQPQVHWSLAWAHLPLFPESGPFMSPHSTLADACRLLQLHLTDNPADATARWLLALLEQRRRRALPPAACRRQCGPLAYWLQFDAVPRRGAADACGDDATPASWTDPVTHLT
eukprot:EG_transcript_683